MTDMKKAYDDIRNINLYLIKWTILPVSKSMVKNFGACFYIQDASLINGLNRSKIAGNGHPMGILDGSKLFKLSG